MKVFKIILMVFGGFFLTSTIVVVPVVIYRATVKSFPDGVWEGKFLTLNSAPTEQLIAERPAVYRLSKDGKVKITLQDPAGQIEGTWQYQSNTLTVSTKGVLLQYKLLEKTSNQVVWRIFSAELTDEIVLKVQADRAFEVYKTVYGNAMNIPDQVMIDGAQRTRAGLPQAKQSFESAMVGQSVTWKRVEHETDEAPGK